MCRNMFRSTWSFDEILKEGALPLRQWDVDSWERLHVHLENSFFESKKHFFDIWSKEKCLWIEESFVDSKKCSLM